MLSIFWIVYVLSLKILWNVIYTVEEGAHVCRGTHLEVEDNLRGLIISFHHVGCGYQIQTVWVLAEN